MKLRGLAALGGVMLLLGCTQGSVAPSASTPTATPALAESWLDRGPITFAVPSGSTAQWRQPIDQWNQEHPQELVSMVEVAGGAGEELADSGRAGSGEFTMFVLDPSWTSEFAQSGWIAPLPNELFDTEPLLSATLTAATWQGELYSYPQSVDVSVLYYRTDELKKSKVPTRWEGLGRDCDQILSGATAGSLTCLVAPLGDQLSLAALTTESAWDAGASTEPGDGSGLSADSLEKELGRYVAGSTNSWVPEGTANWSRERSERAFLSGRSIFYRGWWSSAGRLAVQGSDPTLALAQLPGTTAAGVSVLGGQNLAFSSHGQNLGTAASLAAFLTSTSVQRSMATESLAGPVRSKLYQDQDLLAAVPQLEILSASVETARPLPGGVKAREYVSEANAAVRPALAGTIEMVDALESLRSRLERLAG